MKKKNRKNTINTMEKRIAIIKDFASKMGYSINEGDYHYYGTERMAHSIELAGTEDSEGNPYSWQWFLDTGEEF